jgi:hypothetical protein
MRWAIANNFKFWMFLHWFKKLFIMLKLDNAAVSALKSIGPKVIGVQLERFLKISTSSVVKPPSGPTTIEQDLKD